MGLKPAFNATGAASKVINTRLTQFERIDAAGVQSDQLKLTLDTAGLPGLPAEGQTITWHEGYEGALVNKGDFIITRITPTLFPPSVQVVATAAPFTLEDPKQFKARKSRSFENVSLAEVFRTVVTDYGFSPRVDPHFESVMIEHADQNDETDSAFLTRMARARDAIAKPVNNLYVLARRGQVKTMTGKDIPPVVLSLPTLNEPGQTGFINCQMEKPSKAVFKGVKAKWTDVHVGTEKEEQAGTTPFKRLTQNYSSAALAREACEGELKQIQRKGSKLTISVPGDPKLVAEGLLKLDASFPEFMQGTLSINRVVARGNKGQGYRCTVEASNG